MEKGKEQPRRGRYGRGHQVRASFLQYLDQLQVGAAKDAVSLLLLAQPGEEGREWRGGSPQGACWRANPYATPKNNQYCPVWLLSASHQ